MVSTANVSVASDLLTLITTLIPDNHHISIDGTTVDGTMITDVTTTNDTFILNSTTLAPASRTSVNSLASTDGSRYTPEGTGGANNIDLQPTFFLSITENDLQKHHASDSSVHQTTKVTFGNNFLHPYYPSVAQGYSPSWSTWVLFSSLIILAALLLIVCVAVKLCHHHNNEGYSTIDEDPSGPGLGLSQQHQGVYSPYMGCSLNLQYENTFVGVSLPILQDNTKV